MSFVLILFLLSLLIILFFLYVLYKAYISTIPKVATNFKTPKDFDLDAKSHTLTIDNNEKIETWYIPVKKPKAVVILMYGYATVSGLYSTIPQQAKFLSDAGYSTFLVNPKSLSKIKNNKIYFGAKEWKYAEAIYDFAKSLKENKGKKIGFLGDSMGAVASILVVGKTNKGDFLVAVTPFSSYKNLFSQQIKNNGYPKFLVPLILPFVRLATSLLLRFNLDLYSPDKIISNIKVPIFIISVNKDNWVGDNSGKILFDKARSPKKFWQTNTSHVVFKDSPKEYKEKILHFLRSSY